MPPTHSRSTFQAIVASWLAMKTWVKIWLYFLNAVFLSAFAFWPSVESKVILAAFVASGPLLAFGMVRQRGLTRLLGLAHLIPWLPLVAYLAVRLAGDGAVTDPALRLYMEVLLATVMLCLVADAYDVWRWYRGERFILGSDQAVDAGASRRAPERLPCEPQHA